MNLDLYPAQEPLSSLGAAYQARILTLGIGVVGEEFGYAPDPYQSLAVFRPSDASGDVLVFFHGGGWTSGYKEWMYFMAPALTARGITFVSAGYRLAPQHVFPAGLEDAADAVCWVAQHIGSHGADPRRIFVGGHSAGGHYAALLAATSSWRSSRALDDNVVRGCLPLSGVYRFGEGSGLTVRPRFLGPVADATTDAAASPVLQVGTGRQAPWLIAHGSRDFPHLTMQAREMADALARVGATVETKVLAGCDHFEASVAAGDPDGVWVERATTWMRHVRN